MSGCTEWLSGCAISSEEPLVAVAKIIMSSGALCRQDGELESPQCCGKDAIRGKRHIVVPGTPKEAHSL
jgi:hypothetical protein